MKLAFVLLMLFAIHARADEWNLSDKLLMSSYLTLSAVDAIQTRKVLKSGGSESNPMIGKHPSIGKIVGYKAVGAGIIYMIADDFPENRSTLLIAVNVMQALVVRHNYFELKVNF